MFPFSTSISADNVQLVYSETGGGGNSVFTHTHTNESDRPVIYMHFVDNKGDTGTASFNTDGLELINKGSYGDILGVAYLQPGESATGTSKGASGSANHNVYCYVIAI